MKKVLCFLLMASLWSCKNQDEPKPGQIKLPAVTSRAFYQGDGQYDALGYGIDATLDPVNPNSVSLSPVINTAQFAAAYASQLPSYLSIDNASIGDTHFYSGYTSLDYSTMLTQTKGFSASGSIEGSGTVTTVDNKTQKSLFSASIAKNSSDQTSNAYSSRYAYASAEVYQKIRRLAFTGSTTVDMLMNYLTPAFLSDVNTLSADALVARYGTHVLLDISIGGVLKFNYSAIAGSQTYTSNKTSDIKASLGATVFSVVGANIGYTASSAQVTSIKNSSQNIECSMQYFGGSNSGQSVTVDATGNPTQTINFGSWTSSITPTNAAIVNIGNALYIYDFIADPVKKAAVQTAVENHIAAAQIFIARDPIYQFYTSGTGGDHFLSGDINATNGFGGWQNFGADFKAYLGNVPGTVPVYLFWNGVSGDHFSTTNPNATYGIPNWQYYGIQFYAYPTQVAGTIPIYLFYNNGGGDHFTTSNPNIASQYTGWANYGVAFYAAPN